MSSNIRLQKTCQHCGNRFTAKTTVTQFCSDTCAKRAYKQRKRNEKIEVAIKEETEKALYNPAIAQKEFLTVEEACQLINASRWTIYRLIEKGELKAGKLGRSTRIPVKQRKPAIRKSNCWPSLHPQFSTKKGKCLSWKCTAALCISILIS